MPETLDRRASDRRICFVGLGKMGSPMVGRLLAAGHEVVGYDPSDGAGAELARSEGFERATDLGRAVALAEIVILMVPDSDTVERVVLGGGLLERLPPDAVIVDMSSSEPLRTRQLALQVESAGASLVDAPVSGGVMGAREGALTVMVGGAAPVVERVAPVLSALGSPVTRVGEGGAGHALKALNNLMSATHLISASEAMIAARRFGLDPSIALDIVNGSSGRSGSTENKWPNFVLTGSYDSGFSLRLMLKDMRIAIGLEHEFDGPSALSESAVSLWERAAEEMPGEPDHTEIVKWLEATREPTNEGEIAL